MSALADLIKEYDLLLESFPIFHCKHCDHYYEDPFELYEGIFICPHCCKEHDQSSLFSDY